MTASKMTPPARMLEANGSSLVAKRHQKVSQIVADDLRRKIAHGFYVNGGNLPPESQLISHYGVSRPTIREAVRILETEDLLVTTRGGPKGAKSSRLTPITPHVWQPWCCRFEVRGFSMCSSCVPLSSQSPPASWRNPGRALIFCSR